MDLGCCSSVCFCQLYGSGSNTQKGRGELIVSAGRSRDLADRQPMLYLNPYLAPHVQELYDLFAERAVVQYVEPFATVKISTMASSFGKTEAAMISTLENLIKHKRITGKIDLIDKVSRKSAPGHAIADNDRSSTRKKPIQEG